MLGMMMSTRMRMPNMRMATDAGDDDEHKDEDAEHEDGNGCWW